MGWLTKLLGMGDARVAVRETFTLLEVPDDDPYFTEHERIRELLADYQVSTAEGRVGFSEVVAGNHEPYERMSGAGREQQARYVRCLVQWLVVLDKRASDWRLRSAEKVNLHLEGGWSDVWTPRRLLSDALKGLLKRKLPLDPETVKDMLDWCIQDPASVPDHFHYPLSSLVTAVEEQAKGGEDLESWVPALNILSGKMRRGQPDATMRKLLDRLDALSGRTPELPMQRGEAWSDAAVADVTGLVDPDRARWVELLNHCKTSSGATPSAKWLGVASGLLAKLEQQQFIDFVQRWFGLADKKRTARSLTDKQWVARCAEEKFNSMYSGLYGLLPPDRTNWAKLHALSNAVISSEDPWGFLRDFQNRPEVKALFGDRSPELNVATSPRAYDPVEDQLIIQPHMDVLCGLAWVCGNAPGTGLARSLGMLAASAFRKVPGKGPRAVRVGNACIGALGMMGTGDALGQLALLKVKIKFGGARIAIDKALVKLSAQLEIPKEDLEEMSVPAYGMDEVGELTQEIGGFTAVLTVLSSRTTELVWRREDGKSQKSLPAAVKKDLAEEVKELMASKKDIEKMLPAQAERLDALYLQGKSWPLQIWRERYLDHPLVGALARRLIWNFESGGKTVAGIRIPAGICDRFGHLIPLEEDVAVSLWHPIHQGEDEVQGWRHFLEEWRIVQPFKQAHREIYLVAPAEENTRVYSNRFAAHLLRQHQFHALCAARGWKNRLRLMVDDEYPPATRPLAPWGLRAEYWVEGAGEEMLESGAYVYLSSDQVRFYREDAVQLTAHAGGGGYGASRLVPPADSLSVVEVPPLVFSEVMRDVDLFVGVAGVGNDPNWLDGGTNERHRDYWQNTSFGDLNGSARTRKEVLERLIPKLKIADRCTVGERFLEVRGQRHTYSIHLGSGNILISPQGKYLCIVPAQAQIDKAGEKLFLPFEGDRTLGIILSKAFMLAADDKITDPTILRQL